MKKWASYRVDSPSEIVHTGSFDIGGHRTWTDGWRKHKC